RPAGAGDRAGFEAQRRGWTLTSVLWHRPPGRPASESRRLCHDPGLHGRAIRRPKGPSVAFAPIPPLQPIMHAVSEYRPVKPDLSIHKIRKGAPSSDEDWYTVGFQVPPGSTPQGFVAKFSLKAEDPSLGVLFLDLWQSDLCTPGGPPIRVAGGDIL